MNIALLSCAPKLYTTRRLIEAGRALGHKVSVINTLACELYVEGGAPLIYYKGKVLERPDVIVPRIGASITQYGLAVVNQFEMMDVPIVNNSVPIARARDKLRALQLLGAFNLDVPRTLITRHADDLDEAVAFLGGFPVILKVLQGTQGVGVMIAQSREEAASVLDAMWEIGQDIMLQEFIRESKGRDVRALVVGDKVVGAMTRVAKRGEFRSNLHRGAKGKAIRLDKDYAEAAVKAAHIMGLEIAGVDLLFGAHGPRLMEVNASPGIEGLEAATKKPIAETIIAHVVEYGTAFKKGFRRERLV